MHKMTEQEKHEYARTLILLASDEIEYLSVFECAEDEISEEDAREVLDLTTSAVIEVTWID